MHYLLYALSLANGGIIVSRSMASFYSFTVKTEK